MEDRTLDTWRLLKRTFHTEDGSRYMMMLIQHYCKLQSNRMLPILIRSEGGLGGDSNYNCKQIRPLRYCYEEKDFIEFSFTNSSSGKDTWSKPEMVDLKDAINSVLGGYTKGYRVSKCRFKTPYIIRVYFGKPL